MKFRRTGGLLLAVGLAAALCVQSGCAGQTRTAVSAPKGTSSVTDDTRAASVRTTAVIREPKPSGSVTAATDSTHGAAPLRPEETGASGCASSTSGTSDTGAAPASSTAATAAGSSAPAADPWENENGWSPPVK